MKHLLSYILLCFLLGSCQSSAPEQADYEDLFRPLEDKAWVTFAQGEHEQAIQLTHRILRIADSLQLVDKQAYNHSCLGLFHENLLQYDSAEAHYLASIQLRESIDDITGIVGDYGRLCGLKHNQRDLKEAIQYGLMGTSLLKANASILPPKKLALYQNLANAYADNNDTLEARKYYSTALKLTERLDEPLDHWTSLYNKAVFHYELSELDSAKTLTLNALRYFEDTIIDSKPNEGITYDLLGSITLAKDSLQKANAYLQKSIELNREAQSPQPLFESFISMSLLKQRQNDLASAMSYTDSAALQLESFEKLNAQQKLFQRYSDIYHAKGNTQQAYRYLVAAENLEDSIMSTEKSQSILQTRRISAEQNEARILKEKAIMEARNARLLSWLLGFAFFASLVFLRLNALRLRKKRELEDYQDKQERMTNERIIEGNKQTRKEVAIELHDHISRPLTYIKRLLEPVQEELSFDEDLVEKIQQVTKIADTTYQLARDISYQLRPEEIDWIDDIKQNLASLRSHKTTIEVPNFKKSDFSAEKGRLISTIVGNLLSNVVRWAKAEHVTVLIKENLNSFDILVEDNGIGFDVDNTRGVGLDSINTHAKALNAKLKIDSAPGQGTRTLIQIPLDNE